jgi:5-methylcytosine-specific restriction endonuclease McrA
LLYHCQVIGMLRRKFTANQRRIILAIYGHACIYCKASLTDDTAQIDHVIPFSQGGATSIRNGVPSCKKCNLQKGVRCGSNGNSQGDEF